MFPPEIGRRPVQGRPSSPPSRCAFVPLAWHGADLAAHAARLKRSNMNSGGRWRFKKQGITVSFGHAALELFRRARSSPAGFPSDNLEAWIEIAQVAVGPGCPTTPDVLGAVGLELKNRAKQYDLRTFVVEQLATAQPMPGSGASAAGCCVGRPRAHDVAAAERTGLCTTSPTRRRPKMPAVSKLSYTRCSLPRQRQSSQQRRLLQTHAQQASVAQWALVSLPT